jgi:hypothetical protein
MTPEDEIRMAASVEREVLNDRIWDLQQELRQVKRARGEPEQYQLQRAVFDAAREASTLLGAGPLRTAIAAHDDYMGRTGAPE